MKGMDPLVSTIVLVLIAVSIAATIINWQGWFLPTFAENVGGQGSMQLRCIRASAVLENLTYDCNSNCLPGVTHTLTARIRNTGDIPLQLNSLQLRNQAGELSSFNLNSTLALDQAIEFTNSSTADCRNINHSLALISVLTNCQNVPGTFGDEAITWINC